MLKARSASRGIDLLQKKREAANQIPYVSSIREYLDTCHQRLRPEAAKQLSAVIQVSLKDKAAGVKHHFHFDIDKVRGCFLREGKHPSPSVTLKTTVGDFLKISNGDINAFLSVLKGVVKVRGSAELQWKLFAILPSRPKLASPKQREVDPETCPTALEFQGTYTPALYFNSPDDGEMLFQSAAWPGRDTCELAAYGSSLKWVKLFVKKVTRKDAYGEVYSEFAVGKYLVAQAEGGKDWFFNGTSEMNESYAFELEPDSTRFNLKGYINWMLMCAELGNNVCIPHDYPYPGDVIKSSRTL